MKKSNLLAIAAMAVTGLATYIIRKAICAGKEKSGQRLARERSRHLTSVFSNAKAAVN